MRCWTHGGPNEVDNRLSLCSIHHKLFDKGVLGIAADHKVAVSEHFIGRSPAAEQLVPFPCRPADISTAEGATRRSPLRTRPGTRAKSSVRPPALHETPLEGVAEHDRIHSPAGAASTGLPVRGATTDSPKRA